MTNEEFLSKLEKLLEGKLPPQEIWNVMEYHREYFAEAGENAAAELDPPEVIAQRVLEEYFTPPAKKKVPTWVKPCLIACVAIAAAVGLSAAVRGAVWTIARRTIGSRTEAITYADRTAPVDEVVLAGTADAVETQIGDRRILDWTLETPLEGIIVEGVSDDVVLLRGEEYTLHAERDSREALDYSVEDGILCLEGHVSGGFPLGYENGEICITIPADCGLGLVKVDADMGNILLDGVGADTAELDAQLGTITVSGGRFGALDCEADVGDVRLESVEIDDLQCQCDAGSIEAMELSAMEAELEADLGSINVLVAGSQEEYGLELEVDLGEVSVAGKTVPASYSVRGKGRNITANADAGSITVDFTD